MRHITRLAALVAMSGCLQIVGGSDSQASIADCGQPAKVCCPQINVYPVLRCRVPPANALRAPVIRPVSPMKVIRCCVPAPCCAPRPACCPTQATCCAPASPSCSAPFAMPALVAPEVQNAPEAPPVENAEVAPAPEATEE